MELSTLALVSALAAATLMVVFHVWLRLDERHPARDESIPRHDG